MQALGEKFIKNALIYPCQDFHKDDLQGIYDENGDKIFGKILDHKPTFKNAEFINEKVVFLGFFKAHYGHFITEEICRLWWILQNGVKGKKFVYSRLKSPKFSTFESFILSLFGLDESNLIPITKPTKFVSLILPDDSFWNENAIETHRKVIDFITSKVKPIKNEALYLSRRKFQKASYLEFGEQYFEKLYAKKGYKIVYPETLSPQEQLGLWGGGNKFAAVGGTLPHNMIFAPYGSELEIVLKLSSPNPFQAIINKIKKLKVTNIDVYIELWGIDTGRGPFLILPRNFAMDARTLQDIKRDIANYLAEYEKDLVGNKLYLGQKPSEAQLKESFAKFKEDIREVNIKLFEALNSEFALFEKFIKLYCSYPKLAYCFYRVRFFPLIFKKEVRRTMRKVGFK